MDSGSSLDSNDITLSTLLPMTRLLSRLTLALLLLAATYLIVVNTALNLPATRAFLSGLQPEELQVAWRHAWSLYPLRLELTEVASDGQTATEQWQVDVRRAGASVSLLPLLRGEIRVHDLDLTDIDLRLRPLPRPDASQDDLAPFYPVIRNRNPNAIAEAVREDAGGDLVLEIDDIHVNGEHSFWVSHVRGSVPGMVRGSFRMESAAGRLALAKGALDLTLTSLTVGPKEPVSHSAVISGEIDIPPFTLSEIEGLEFMRLPELNALIDLPVRNLDFLALLVPPLGDLALSGQGQLRGRLALSGGEVLSGTDLVVEAHALAMDLGRYAFSGDGSVEFKVDPEDEAQADLMVRFDRVQAELEPDDPTATDGPEPLFSGRGLTARLHAAEVDPTTTSTAKHVEELASEVRLSFLLTIPSMQAPDLAVYSRLFPRDWDLHLLGGTGTVSGTLEVTPERLSLDLDLASDDADLRYQRYQASTDLLLHLRALVDDATGPRLHLDGTTLRMKDAQFTVDHHRGKAGHRHIASRWLAELRITGGDLRLPASAEATDPIPAVAQTLNELGFGALLGGADGRLSAVLNVSQLDWIAELVGRPFNLSLTGAGELDADLLLTDGRPDKGTTLTLPREALSLALLDHRVDGQGKASLRMEHGGKSPRFRLDFALEDGRMRRRDEPEPSIGEVRMDAEILVTDPLAVHGGSADVNLKLHSARVRDMSTYNAYLPPNTPFSLRSGEASLVGDLRLQPHSTVGELLLQAGGMRVGLDQEELSGNLRLDILIRDGSAQDMRFDITGSSIVLDGFQVIGDTASATAPDWHARLQLEETEVHWRKPMHLEMEAGLSIKDTRPFVALLDNARGQHGWIDELLTVEDPVGYLRLAVDGKSVVVEDAMLIAPEIGIHAKGRSTQAGREAMLLLRWHNLSGALELQNNQMHFAIGDAPARFAAYLPGKTPLPFMGSKQTQADLVFDAEPFAGSESPQPMPSDAQGGRPAARPSQARSQPQTSPDNPFLQDGF